MIFNPLRAYDIAPTIYISPGTCSEVVEEFKILGTIVRSDMKTINTIFFAREDMQECGFSDD